ncbi:MAG: tetratricopeptide repeat protein [Caldilineales bacterium]|nr:tetratricopeptide repeat protein [Caldilineales bacterium]
MLIDWSLVATIGFIFLVTLIGAWLRSRRRDPCLVAFEDFHVTLERTDNKIIWGKLKVTPTGLELIYRRAVQDEEHIESSYALYNNEYTEIQAIYRYADQLDEENQKRRAKDLKKWFHPGPMRFLMRKTRGFLATASESLNEVIGIILGRMRKPAGRYMTDTSETYLKKFGGDLIGHAGSANDPMLEQFIGQRVVFELVEDGEVHEHVGIFKNYSADFYEVFDVQFPIPQSVPVEKDCTVATDRITAVESEGKLNIKNNCGYPILIQSLKSLDESAQEDLLNVVVDAGEEIVLHPPKSFDRAKLQVKVVRELDMIVPRTRGVIRHRAVQVDSDKMPDIIFDLGVVLRARNRDEAHEQRLRELLSEDPQNAMAAANLGGILLQKGHLEEADVWLNRAIAVRDSLPDRGRRAEMQLRELARKVNQQEEAQKPDFVKIVRDGMEVVQ